MQRLQVGRLARPPTVDFFRGKTSKAIRRTAAKAREGVAKANEPLP
jgi:hypothetical protein